MVVKHHSLKHYKDEHYKAIEDAKSFEELAAVAIDVLKSMPQPINHVCGPMSTGGLDNIEKNSIVMENTMHKLSDQGKNIFNWVPFNEAITRIRKQFSTHSEESNRQVVYKFYIHIFNSGLIKKLYFIHGWESSQGAKWEHEQGIQLGLEIENLPKDFLDDTSK